MGKKITKWEPDDFELQTTTMWSFPDRGNWSPYIPRNLILRYSKEKDLILDQFAGGGTTLIEAKLLNRNIVGVDVNDIALERCREKINFHHEGADGDVQFTEEWNIEEAKRVAAEEAAEKATEKINALNKLLIAAKRFVDLEKAANDVDFQNKLIKELLPA